MGHHKVIMLLPSNPNLKTDALHFRSINTVLGLLDSSGMQLFDTFEIDGQMPAREVSLADVAGLKGIIDLKGRWHGESQDHFNMDYAPIEVTLQASMLETKKWDLISKYVWETLIYSDPGKDANLWAVVLNCHN